LAGPVVSAASRPRPTSKSRLDAIMEREAPAAKANSRAQAS
jgi:hypothetical protein